MKAKKVVGPPPCHRCNTLLIGSDRNVCPKCSIKYCSLCHGGVYYIDPVTKVEAKNCSTCADSPDEEDKQTVSSSFFKPRTNRHFHAELRRKQQDELLAKHQLEAEPTGDVEGQRAGRATTDLLAPRLSRGVAAVIKRKAPKPTNVDVEVSSNDERPLDLDETLGYWEGTEDESEVNVMTRSAKQKRSGKEKSSKPQRTQERKGQVSNGTQRSGLDRGNLIRASASKNINVLQPKNSEKMNRISKAADRGKLTRASAIKNTNALQGMSHISKAYEAGVTTESQILTGNKIYIHSNPTGKKSSGKAQ